MKLPHGGDATSRERTNVIGFRADGMSTSRIQQTFHGEADRPTTKSPRCAGRRAARETDVGTGSRGTVQETPDCRQTRNGARRWIRGE